MPILGKVVKRAVSLRQKIKLKEGEPLQYQLRALTKLLRAAKDTEFGRTYAFEEIINAENPFEAFANHVPVSDYSNMYQHWWKRAMHGEQDIFWPGKVKYFALSSGTSDNSSKYIPVTKEMLKSITRASAKQIYSMTNFNLPSELYQKEIFTLGGSTRLIKQGDYYVGDMSGISAHQSIPFWINRFFKPGKKINEVRDWEMKLNAIARHAREWDIGVICGIPSWVQLMFERILEHNKAENIFDIWPNLGVYIHGGVAFDPYKKNFEKIFNNHITYIETYMASEGFFAFRNHPDHEGMNLILNNGIYYEFAPFNSDYFDEEGQLKAGKKLINIGEVKENVDYVIYISTNSGAWRYMIGDTIKFLNAEQKEIVVTGRTKHFLSICGEHLSVDNMNKAIQLAADELKIFIPEFTVSGIPFQNLFAHRWYIGTDDPVDADKLKHSIDTNLRKLNDDYATERDNVLRDIQVRVVPVDRFYTFLKECGKIGDQSKFPRVMKGEKFRDWENFNNSKT
jgi:GH3 auxin-responsive promoter